MKQIIHEKNLITGSWLLTIFLTVTFLFAGISCDKHGPVSPDEGYYTCSMHPQVIQQEPGICPICNMNLTFVPAKKKRMEDHSGHAEKSQKGDHKSHSEKSESKLKSSSAFTFSLAEDLLQNAKVYTIPAKKESFSRNKNYSGHIDYNEDPDRLVIITTKYDGWIEKLHVSKEGQSIKKGQLMMGIYSQKILAAKEEYLTTYQSIKNSYVAQGKDEAGMRKDPTLVASKRKLIYLDVPASQISILEKSGKAERLTFFRAPISGILTKKSVLQGSFIKSGQELFRIANLRSLWVFIHIFEKDISFIKKGQKVNIKTTAYPGKIFKGKIDLIYPYLDMMTKDVKVRIVVPNENRLLKPGMFTNVEVRSALSGKVITIPEQSVIYSGEENYVFVSLGDGEFEVRPVVVLTRSNGKAVITKGLKKNDLVVANGQFLLDSEASLKEAMLKGQMTGHQH